MDASFREFGSLLLDGRVVTRLRVEALVLVVEGNGEQEAVVAPDLDRLRVDVEHLGDFDESQQAGVAQALVAALERVVASDVTDHEPVECSAFTGGKATVIEDGGDLPLCVRVE